MPLSRGRVVTGVAIALVAGAVIAGLVIAGSPAEARLHKLDDRRVEDLARAADLVRAHWGRTGSLPSSMDEAFRNGGLPAPVDPTSRLPYEYHVTGADAFEVCAVFDRVSVGEPPWAQNGSWLHDPGRRCFPQEAKKR
jgi:hypothetical protein